jgi:hypothetical protein
MANRLFVAAVINFGIVLPLAASAVLVWIFYNPPCGCLAFQASYPSQLRRNAALAMSRVEALPDVTMCFLIALFVMPETGKIRTWEPTRQSLASQVTGGAARPARIALSKCPLSIELWECLTRRSNTIAGRCE